MELNPRAVNRTWAKIMKTHSYRREQDRTDVVTLEMAHCDRDMMLNVPKLMEAVRYELAKEITKRIVADLGPILDRVIAKCAESSKSDSQP